MSGVLAADLRHALRGFAGNPAFAATALLSLALGIGANTAVFSIASALLLKPLPYRDAERLVLLWNRSPGLGIAEDWFSTAQYFDIRNGHQGFEQLAIAIGGNMNLTGDGEPERIGAIRVSSDLLPMLGVSAAQGRIFGPEDDNPGAAPAVLLSHGLWTRRYGADPRTLGRTLTINGQPYQVVGILPLSFSLPREVLPTLGGAEQADVLLPLPLSEGAAQVRTREDYNIIGKLKPGLALRAAQSEMDLITARLRREFPNNYPPNGGLTFSIVPLIEQVVGGVRRTLWVLLAAVGFVLLIACGNVANLMLSRGLARQNELGLRAAVGASRSQIARHLLTESLLLSLGGAALGVLVALFGVSWIRLAGAGSIPRLASIAVDGRVLLFTFLLALLSGVLAGLVPAIRLSNIDLRASLSKARRGSRARRLLVIGELALSTVLVVGAGLLFRSLALLENVHPGFDAGNVLTLQLALNSQRYAQPQSVMDAYRRLWERLAQLPGVSAAGGTSDLPLSQSLAWTPITIEGRLPPAGEKFVNSDMRVVGGAYFQAMHIPLRSGRYFNAEDTVAKPRVIIIDEHMARQFWPGEDPVGKRIHIVELKTPDPWQRIVGVVGRVKHDGLDSEPRIVFYVSQTQFPARAMTVVLRGESTPAAVTKEIRALDPDLPVYSVKTMRQRVDESLARRRFVRFIMGLFAALAASLAAIGVYGVLAYLVVQGQRDIGIRIALGASRPRILSFVLKQGLTLALAGLAIGAAAAAALTRFMRSLLFGIEPTDAVTFAVVTALLAGIALLASALPARRAALVDPMSSLRCE